MKTSHPDNHFCRKLRELRESAGLTVEEFCNQFNSRFDGRMNKSTVSRYENGLQEPMISTVKKIATFFSIDPSDLIGYTPSGSKPSILELSPEIILFADVMNQLNDEGREKLMDYASDLVASGRYIKSSAPGLGKAQV